MPSALTAPSPIGPLGLYSEDGEHLTAIRFDAERQAIPAGSGEPDRVAPVLVEAARQLEEYFAGARRRFELPVAGRGSVFQRSVWQAVESVGYGQTVTYGELARSLGLPLTASRAVGAANGANPLPIVCPCHRVIGANGRLVGYGGGLARKEALLRLEGVRIGRQRDQLPLFFSERSEDAVKRPS